VRPKTTKTKTTAQKDSEAQVGDEAWILILALMTGALVIGAWQLVLYLSGRDR
jgi:hypothetical protein